MFTCRKCSRHKKKHEGEVGWGGAGVGGTQCKSSSNEVRWFLRIKGIMAEKLTKPAPVVMIILYLTGVNRNVFAYLLLRRRTRIHTMTLFILKRYHRMKEDFFFFIWFRLLLFMSQLIPIRGAHPPPLSLDKFRAFI